jgi:predicted nucleic acid-binding protein
MRVLIDTNIVLDVLLNRKPFSDYSAAIFKYAEQGRIKAFLTSNSVTDIVYILRKSYNMDVIRDNMMIMFGFIKILNVSSGDILKALDSNANDFEDAVIIQCASRMKADYIVTRNPKDFKSSSVRAVAAEEFVSMIIS